MKISPGQVNGVLNSYRQQIRSDDKAKGSQDFKASLNQSDRTQLSEEARLHQVAMKALKNMPDVREDRVAELKKAIESGSYQVSGKEIAEKMLERSAIDRLM
ncbi:MAG: flagellar biosynthesis anti-sigma factor FlgM [Clostridia bacterium]|nr:flagellar biosynthesis anti-sigma factor FlgM [Clostridia bacterium]